MRQEHPEQTLSEFTHLGHYPVEFYWVGAHRMVTKCSVCTCWLGSQMACNPCGDPLGSTLRYVAPSKGAFFYNGTRLI